MGSLDTSKAESERREKWLQKSSESSSRSSSHPLHSHFSLDLHQRIVAQTGTALDSGERLARAGDQISSSFSRLAPGRGHTLCLVSVTWCRTQGVTLEISSAAETGATTDLAAQIVSRAKTAGRERGVNPGGARGDQGEPELVESSSEDEIGWV